MHIGGINCSCAACADDVALISIDSAETQTLVSIAEQFSCSDSYQLQPKKTEHVPFYSKSNKRKDSENSEEFNLYGKPITKVQTATHLGIKRSSSLNATAEAQLYHNINQSRRKLYSMMGTGLHGNNGLDPLSALSILKVYIIPTLLYGLEIIKLNTSHIESLEKFQKKIVKFVEYVYFTAQMP